MKITFDTKSYNERRYGKPYIALIDFTDPKGTPTWGNWIGQAGEDGLLEIDAQPGDVLMRGQKDGRGNNPPAYLIVSSDGSTMRAESKAEAYKHWKNTRALPAVNPL